MIIPIVSSLIFCREYGYHITEKILDLSIRKNKKLEEISAKLEFLKQQQGFRHISKLPTKEDIHTLLTVIKQEPKKVEQEIVQLIKKLEDKVQRLEDLVNKLTTLIKKNIGDE